MDRSSVGWLRSTQVLPSITSSTHRDPGPPELALVSTRLVMVALEPGRWSHIGRAGPSASLGSNSSQDHCYLMCSRLEQALAAPRSAQSALSHAVVQKSTVRMG